MMQLFLIMSLIVGHFVGDFVFQTRYMGNNKSSNTLVLLDHVYLYTLVLMLFLFPFIVFSAETPQGLFYNFLFFTLFAFINFWLHFATDYCSSRLSKYYWSKGNEHAFWCVIGADQALHMSALLITGFVILL